MSERPTPEQIAASQLSIHRRGNPAMSGPNPQDVQRAETLIGHLRHHGYAIVHPDDHPAMSPDDELFLDAPYGAGWNDCRGDIFGGDHE